MMPETPDSAEVIPCDIHIVPSGPSDIDELLPLMREFYAGEKLTYDEPVLRRALGALWAEPLHGGAWIARDAGEAVGYAVLCCGFSLEYRGRDAFVDELFVRPGWRNLGIGSGFLDAMEAACRDRGIAAFHLEVDNDNFDGERLYVRRGFVDHDRHLMTKWLDH
jgi:GNAT superfamily N-acetyltransferase